MALRFAPKRQAVLARHGFTETESRVYLALLDQATMSAGELSRVASVPRSHLYKVLSDLHARGVVDILAAPGTREYRARPFAEFLRTRSGELRDRLLEVESDIETLGPVMQPPDPGTPGSTSETSARVMLGRRAVAREIDAILEGAQREVLIATTEGSSGRLARHASAHESMWSARKTAATVVLPPSLSSAIEWERLVANGSVAVRWAASTRTAFVVIADGSQMILVRPSPDSSELRQGKDFGVVVVEPAIVRSVGALIVDASATRPPA